MSLLKRNVSLQPYHTFGVDVPATYYAEVLNPTELRDLFSEYPEEADEILVLGDGSNVLFTQPFDGLIIRPLLHGITIEKETDQYLILRAGAGEKWDDVVQWAVNRGLGGAENLSLIPGTVGASPIQNIGAYGVEVCQVIEEVEAFSIQTGDLVRFSPEECGFSYRNSIFKGSEKGKYIITAVTYRFQKDPELHLDYGDIRQRLEGIAHPTPADVRRVVSDIRTSKLPDPAVLGNAGSFFKNPIISLGHAEKLRQQYPDIPLYYISETERKISAAWMIQQCGWRGKRIGQVGTYEKQPLVIVNYGGATGAEIFETAQVIQWEVEHLFEVALDIEVNVF
ncbi:MAG: UDP-N-acetylmuramate dehydrogenase [Bacteroidales bacterium]|nr:UDP-N-acetylmuramate dehydrogenase [Bacteroidales bacterium]